MSQLHRTAAVLLCSGLLGSLAVAQTPARDQAPTEPAARRNSPPVRDTRPVDRQARYDGRSLLTDDDRSYDLTPGERSVLRAPRNPYHTTYGWRNPGGVGRRAEYYPPGDRFQNETSAVRVA